MKILMIGNGFDLEHGLPTKYTDFLDYIITFRGYYARVYQGQVKPRCDADKGDYFEKLFSDKKNHYKVEALQAMTKDNLWIDYFIKVREQHLKNKENWIDFESEISRIVQDLDEFQKIAGSSSRTEEYYHYKEKLREILEQEDLTPEAIPKTIDKLMLELNKLICALEIYLDDYVGGKEIILYNPDIAQIHPDNVISFNYTDTFRKVYCEYDTNTLPSFVHGMATDHTDRFRVRLRKKAIKMPIGLNEPLRRTIWSLVLMNICRRIVELQRLILLNSRSFISGFIKEQAMNTRSGCWQMNRKCYIYSDILWMLRTGISCGNSSSGMMLRR